MNEWNLKFGCCTNFLILDESSIGFEYLDTLYELGYDYVELPLKDLMNLNEEDFNKVKEYANNKLPVYACNYFFSNDIQLCGNNPTPTNIVIDYCEKALSCAANIGAKIAVFGSPNAKYCPDGFDKDKAFNQLVEACKLMGDIARKNNILIVLEPNNQLETNMINTYDDVLKLIKAVNHPNIQGLQDYFHLKQEKDTVDSIIYGKQYLKHTHFACYEGRKFAKSLDEDSYYLTYFKTLKDIEYCGGVSMEGFIPTKDSFKEEASNTLTFFKNIVQLINEKTDD